MLDIINAYFLKEAAHIASMSMLDMSLYIGYFFSGIFLPLTYIKQAKIFLRGNSGIGDTCIKSLRKAMLWRCIPLLYCVKIHFSLPFFLAVAFDILGRVYLIWAASKADKRYKHKSSRKGH